MGLVGEWGRGVFRAGGVALLVPLAMLGGVAFTTALGGGQRVRALGQVLAGPTPPPADVSAAREDSTRRQVPLLHVRRRSPIPLARRPVPGRALGPRPAQRGATHRAPAPRRAPHRRPAPASGTAPPPASGAAPAPPPGPVRQAGEQAAGAAAQAPAPAGPVAAAAVQTVVDIISPPPGR